MNEARRVAIRNLSQRMVQSAQVALGTGSVSPTLQDRIHRDITFFTELDALLEECTSLNHHLREAITEKAGERLTAWIADGGCSWLGFGQDGPGGLH